MVHFPANPRHGARAVSASVAASTHRTGPEALKQIPPTPAAALHAANRGESAHAGGSFASSVSHCPPIEKGGPWLPPSRQNGAVLPFSLQPLPCPAIDAYELPATASTPHHFVGLDGYLRMR